MRLSSSQFAIFRRIFSGFWLTGGEVHDNRGFLPLLRLVTDKIKAMLADMGYDAIREELLFHGIEPVIPSKKDRKQPIPYDHVKYIWAWRPREWWHRHATTN